MTCASTADPDIWLPPTCYHFQPSLPDTDGSACCAGAEGILADAIQQEWFPQHDLTSAEEDQDLAFKMTIITKMSCWQVCQLCKAGEKQLLCGWQMTGVH